MLELTFGLPRRHPAVAAGATAIAVDFIYVIATLAIGQLPEGVVPYYRLPLGGIAMYVMSMLCFSQSDSKAVHIMGYAMAAMNLAVSIGFIFIFAAYISGPNSSLWGLLLRA